MAENLEFYARENKLKSVHDKMAQEDKKQNVDIFALIQQQFEQLRNVDEKQQSNNFLPSSDGSNAENWPEQTLVCCGSSNSGKSSLISLFLSAFSARHISSAVPSSAIDQKTIALEFRFGTRIWGENNKQLVNVWELAGGGTMAPLVQIPLQKRNIRATSLLLFLDLTRPELLQSVAETLMTACRKQIESLLADNKTPQAAIGRNELQNLNSEQKRQTYRLIRQFAHINGAAIITLSIRMDSLLTKARTFLTNLVNAPPLQQIQKSLSTDPQQPLFVVPHGTDSFEDINPSLRSLNSFSEAMLNFLQSLNQTFAQQQQESSSAAVQDDEANDGTEEGEEMKQQLAEPEIDALVEERTRLLELFAREKRDRREAEKRAADRRQ
ncbi:Cytoplasmic dynein 2 light intermediate chain 1 [Globodera pallida]|nr:Cytoplasmic dynein 2 light intermediate chain 1 [Globodera pallida]